MTIVTALKSFSQTSVADPLALLIGMSTIDLPKTSPALSNARLESLPYVYLHAALAQAPWVDYVVSPLVTEQFDALDLACALERAGFDGHYMVVMPHVPRPGIVKRELQQIAPGVQVSLIGRCLN